MNTGEASSTPRKRGRPRDTRLHAEILDATAELVQELGYEKTTMERVAGRTGVSRATLYRWWDGKGQLVIESLMEKRKHPPVAIPDDFDAGLEELINSMVDSIVAPHNLDALLGLEYDSRYDTKLEQTLRASRVETTNVIESVFRQAKNSGRISKGFDEDTVYHLLYGGAMMMANHSRGSSKKKISQQLNAFFRLALHRNF